MEVFPLDGFGLIAIEHRALSKTVCLAAAAGFTAGLAAWPKVCLAVWPAFLFRVYL
jgi:hypothetical protein